jgi:hypothetical protein
MFSATLPAAERKTALSRGDELIVGLRNYVTHPRE